MKNSPFLPSLAAIIILCLDFTTSVQAQCDVQIDLNMPTPASCTNKLGYNLILADEFDTFNSSVWDKSSVGDDLACCYSNPNLCAEVRNTPMNTTNVLTPSGGILDIRVREGEDMNACDYSGGEIKSFNADGSGGSFRDWKVPPNSYIETRLKIPGCSGVGAAFWLRGAILNRYHELDIFEHDSDEPDKVKSNIHYGYLAFDSDEENLQTKSICDLLGNSIDLDDQFITFGAEISDSWVKVYLNNTLIQNYQYWPNAGSPLNSPLPYDIRLSSVNNPHGGDPSECNTLPQNFKIDYVRIYQKSGSTAVKFDGASPGKVTLCTNNSCNGQDFCNWVYINYYPGATYEWDNSSLFYLINESSTSENLQKYSVWTYPGTPPGDYQLKLTVNFPCNGYKEDLILKIKVFNQIPSTPSGIFLVTDDNNFFYPGVYINNNSTSYEWSLSGSSIWHEVANPLTGNKNIWEKFFKATTFPRQVTVCVRAKNACGTSPSFCQTLTIPAKDLGCVGCHYQLLPPREILVEQIASQSTYRLKVLQSPYSQSYEWSLDQKYWHDLANNQSNPYNDFSPFEAGLDSFLVFVRAKNQDTLSAVFSQKVATPGEPPLPKPVVKTHQTVAKKNHPSQEREIEVEEKNDLYQTYMLYNSMGQIMRSDRWNNFSIEELRQSLSPGLYILVKFSDDLTQTNVSKLLITR